MDPPLLHGLVAATVTPFKKNGDLDLGQVPLLTEHLIRTGVTGLYVCGSTGEGVSLDQQERKDTAEAYVRAAAGRLPVVVQVGHNSLRAAADLAAHAQHIGADGVSATCPSYFPIRTVEALAEAMLEVATAAPQIPFYYYHIPVLTGVDLDMVRFLQLAQETFPNLRGVKFTTPAAHIFQECLELDEGRFEVLWGCDEMLLSALAVGAYGAVGSTYNIAAPIYHHIIREFQNGDLIAARRWQARAVAMIRVLTSYPFHAALRETLLLLGLPCGSCRQPNRPLQEADKSELRSRLEQLGFFQWIAPPRDAAGMPLHDASLRAHPPQDGQPNAAALKVGIRRHESV